MSLEWRSDRNTLLPEICFDIVEVLSFSVESQSQFDNFVTLCNIILDV